MSNVITEYEIRVLLRDLTSEFLSKRRDALSYTLARRPWLTDDPEKIRQEVERVELRCSIVERIRTECESQLVDTLMPLLNPTSDFNQAIYQDIVKQDHPRCVLCNQEPIPKGEAYCTDCNDEKKWN